MIKILNILLCLSTLNLNAQVANFTFKLKVPSVTSAGVYSGDETLVRTLWNCVKYPAGNVTQNWDGKDDNGIPVTDKNFHVKLVSNNVTYKWEGTIGNTSDSLSGLTKHRGYYQCMRGLAFSGNTGYFCTGYSEGSPSLAKFKISTPNQKKRFFTSKTQSGQIDFVATDDAAVYWSVYDAFKRTSSFVFATKVSNDEEINFENGQVVTVKYGKTYNHAISVVNQQNGTITGLAVQKKGSYLFVTRAGLDELQIINKTTGEIIAKEKMPIPRNVCVDAQDNLWMISGINRVAKYTIDDKGKLAESNISIEGLLDPVAIQVSTDGKLLTVADGGTSGQIKFFDVSNSKLISTLGKEGGYFLDASVNNNKFYFNDARGKQQTFIAYEPNGSFWVSDPGNYRVQHYDAKHTFIDRIMSLGAIYSTWVDKNNITRLWADYMEFAVDYSVPLSGKTGWKLVKNWGANVTSDYDKTEKFRYITTLLNGRTYGFLRTKQGREIVEFPDKGQLRFSGVIRRGGLGFYMEKDGAIVQYNKGSLGAVSVLYKYPLAGFDAFGNPTWSTMPEVLATTPPLTMDDPNATPQYESVTSTGKVIIYNYNSVQRFSNNKPEIWATGYHLGAIQKGSNKWLWKTEKATNRNYEGNYPGSGYFDIGNGVNNYAGGGLCIIDRNIITTYHGEFWKASQTNKYNHYLDNGLAIGQFGITRPETLDHATAGMAGNALTPIMVKAPSGDYYLYHGDESDHAGVHRWKISGLNTIIEQDVPLKYSPLGIAKKSSTGIDLMESLPHETTLTNENATGWQRSPAEDITVNKYNNIFTATTNVLKYEKFESPDIFIKFSKQEPVTYTVSRDLGENNVTTSWTLSGYLAYPGNMPNGINIEQYFEVIDNNDKVLTSFYVNMNRNTQPFSAIVYGNKKIIVSGEEKLIRKNMSAMKSFEVSVTNGMASFKYDNYKIVKAPLFDPKANWKSPKSIRCRFVALGGKQVYGANIGLKDFIFFKK